MSLRSMVKRTLNFGISSKFLIARAKLLRSVGALPPLQKQSAATEPQAIFFSFPYHSVGDTILSLTLLDRLHRRWPAAAIDVAVSQSMAPLLEAIPYVRTVFQHQRAKTRYMLLDKYVEVYGAARLYAREIAKVHYDLAVAPRWDSKDSFFAGHLAYLTGAPLRCGYSGSNDGGSREVDRYYTHAAIGGAQEHESLRYQRFLGRCGLEPEGLVDDSMSCRPIAPLLRIASDRIARSEALIAPIAKPYAVLSPGATGGRRMWPIARYAEVAREVFAQSGLRSIVLGGTGDVSLCDELCRLIGPSAVSMAGKTDALQMVDLIAVSSLFLGNDSGPAHIAGGLGIATFVVSPFPASCAIDHFNSPRRFRPAGPQVVVVQPENPLAPCYPMCMLHEPHCILQVSAEEVLGPVLEVVRGMALR